MLDKRSMEKVTLKNMGYKLILNSKGGRITVGISIPKDMSITKSDKHKLYDFLDNFSEGTLKRIRNQVIISSKEANLSKWTPFNSGWKYNSICVTSTQLQKLDAIKEYYGISRSAAVRRIVTYAKVE